MSGKRGKGTRAERPKLKLKPYIYAFYEGESEKQYLELLKKKYENVAIIKKIVKASPAEAVSQFKKERRFRDDAENIDEIWFFLDTRDMDGNAKEWASIHKDIKELRKLRKSPHIRIRIFLTTGCLEYWFLLHFQECKPPIVSAEHRERTEKLLKQQFQKQGWAVQYKKGDDKAIERIVGFEDGQGQERAVKFANTCLDNLKELGLPPAPPLDNDKEPDKLEEGQFDAYYEWLFSEKAGTVTTVQEAICFLAGLESKRKDFIEYQRQESCEFNEKWRKP